MSTRRLRLSAAMFALFVALGCSSTVFGLIVEDISTTLKMSLTYVGLISTLFALGRLASSFGGGLVADTWGYGAVTGMGTGFMIMGSLILTVASSGITVLLGSFFMGLGFGAIDVGLNAGIAILHPQRRGPVLSLLHGFYGVGSFVGPLILGAIIAGRSWPWAPAAIAAIFVVTCIPFAVFYKRHAADTAAARQQPQAAAAPRSHGYKELLGDRVFLLIVVVGFIYLGVSWSLSFWLPTYAAAVHGASKIQAAGAVSIMFVGLTVGRFVNSVVIARLGNSNTLLVGSIGSLTSLAIALLAPTNAVMMAALSVTGLSLAALYPVCIAILTQRMPEAAGSVSGAFVTLSTIGVLLIPWLLGMLADRWGIAAGLGSGVIALVLLVLITMRLRRMLAAERAGAV